MLRDPRASDDPNLLEIAVKRAEITPFTRFNGSGYVESGVVVKMPGYVLEDVIVALLDDYGRDRVLEVIDYLDPKKS